MSDYREEMGNRLCAYRKMYTLTQEEMAEKLDISIKHYSEIERGVTGVSIDMLIDICQTLNLSLDYLVLGITDDVYLTNLYASLTEVQHKKLQNIINQIVSFNE